MRSPEGLSSSDVSSLHAVKVITRLMTDAIRSPILTAITGYAGLSVHSALIRITPDAYETFFAVAYDVYTTKVCPVFATSYVFFAGPQVTHITHVGTGSFHSLEARTRLVKSRITYKSHGPGL